MSSGSAVELRAISKRYRDADRELEVLREVSFRFEAGGRYSIMGRSGVGKSTLLHVLGALDRPSSGEVIYGGTSLQKLSTDQLATFRGQNVGFVFQFHQLLGEFSALENVAMPLFIAELDEAQVLRESRAMLERVGLGARTTHRPGELSGGEQQRVALARALVARPKVLLADEPTGSLDAATAAEIQGLLLELQAEQGFTLIAVTHHRELAAALGTVLEMHAGGHLSAA